MGYLLKEALKALCGVNRWSYAIFWKIGCRNPKLLIWEEYYRTTLSCSNAPHNSTTGNLGKNLQKLESYQNASQVGELVEDQVHLLVDKMMVSNHVNMVGQGLVGRVAFMGNHQWIVSGSYNEKAHPVEVSNEIRLQFSAGMQTVVVIPVIPHGVVQLGSSLAIMENMGFVHDVRSLILQVGCVPNVFVSDNYVTKHATAMSGMPIADAFPVNLPDNRTGMNSSPVVSSGFSLIHNSPQTVKLVNRDELPVLTQFQDNLQVGISTSSMPNLTQDLCKSRGGHCEANSSLTPLDSCVSPNSLVENKITQVAVMLLKPNSLLNNPTCSTNPDSTPSSSSSTLLNQQTVSHEGLPEASLGTSIVSSSIPTSFPETNIDHYATLLGCGTNLSRNADFSVHVNGLSGQSSQKSGCANIVFDDYSVKKFPGSLNTADQLRDNGHTENHISCNFIPGGLCNGTQMPSSTDLMSEDIFFQSTVGDDLFDVLGVDFKNKLLNGNGGLENRFPADQKKDLQNSETRVCSDYEGFSESGIFSSLGFDHLLDAVISGVSSTSRQILDDNVSCRKTVSKISSSSVPDQMQMQGHVPGISKAMERIDEPIRSSMRSGCGKNDGGSCSRNGFAYTSQISSWVEQGPSASVSTENSRKTEETGKSSRKRLKPGENPRPRPKDRQLFQDRLKELREIVPNGAKCTIDALLERTIKHMLFMQSVTKHAEKLKHTVKSKIANKEGGMPLNDPFEGGATWAFELGSQSMVCPIIVEDLNPPRQLLIEMLCDERGMFLEIADIIRGLGMTILKGVMESRSDKIWARFAVEANRDVTRMEVFISLVHLLE